ncbi:MAG: hypothetical protein NC917_01835 [Candidatus Omnitrophica bacterium]|nr:hypothetical protein [Candidatus Omnitrophota bacterium]MCM8810371.1 hypothetical protein [Candidatus Omnitrophota bacterium]
MCGKLKVEDFISGFEGLSIDEKKEVIKKLIPKFCEIAMNDMAIIKEFMPKCMEMMKEMNFPMKDMIFKK